MLAAMRVVLLAIASFFFPGVADGAANRPRAIAMWAVIQAAAISAAAFSVWAMPVIAAIRFAAASAAVRVTRAEVRAGTPANVMLALVAIGVNGAVFVALRLGVYETFKLPSSSMVPTIAVGDYLMTEKITPRFGVGRGDLIVFRHPCTTHDFIKRVAGVAGDTIEVRCGALFVNGAAVPATLVQGEGCAYDDRMDDDDAWRQSPCSEYAEVLGGHRYHTFSSPDRPSRPPGPSPHDFPRLDQPTPPICTADGGGPPATSDQRPGTIVQTKPTAGACEPQLHYVVPAGHIFALGDNRDNSNDSRYWGAIPVDLIRARVTGIWFSSNRGGAFARFGGVE